jgi:hypothetical protein
LKDNARDMHIEIEAEDPFDTAETAAQQLDSFHNK